MRFTLNLAWLLSQNSTEGLPIAPERLNAILENAAPATVDELVATAQWAGVSTYALLYSVLGPQPQPSHPHIRLLALDVDGTLTDCGIYLGPSGEENKRFNAKDGIALRRLVHSGVEVGFLSNSVQVGLLQHRAQMLDIKRVHAAHGQKADVLNQWRQELGLEWSQVAYMGDDVNDLKCIAAAGLSACPADADAAVIRAVDYVTRANGGDAAVREFIHHCLLPIV